MTNRRDRIRAKIMARCVRTADGCLLWTGPTSGSSGRGRGYGRMSLDGATVAVHIAMWVVENGPIPPRKQLDHKCANRLCAEESHLELVTHKENQRRRAKKKKKN